MVSETALEEFCETGSGSTPSRTKMSEYYGGEIPWVKSGELREGTVTSTEESVTDAGVRAARLKIVPKGSLLVAMYGATVGRTALLGIDATTNQAICHVRPDPVRADTQYVWFALQAKLPELLARRVGGAQPNISQETIRTTKIRLPPLAEQRHIANILDKADAIRRKCNEAIALTDELLRSTFLEMFGDPVRNPKRLARGELRDFLLTPLRNGLSPATGGQHKAQVLTLSAITRGAFDGGAKKEGAFAADPWPEVRLDERDFLVCRGNGNRDLVGAGAFPDRSDQSVVFPDTMIAARVDPRRVGRAFLEQLWKSRLVRGHVEASARTTNGTFKVNQGAVEATPILIPEEGDLVRFESFALRQRVLGVRQAAAYESSEALFESLVARAFQGKLASVSQ